MAEALAQQMHTILKNSSNKEAEMNQIILSNDRDTRTGAAIAYYQLFNEDIEEAIKDAFTGDYEHLCVNAFRSPVEYDVHQINRCFKGLSNDLESLYEIVCTRPSWHLKEVAEMYTDVYQKDVKQLIEKETSGRIGKCIRSLFDIERSENKNPDHKTCEAKAVTLSKTKPDKWLEQNIFDDIFAKCSPEELVLIGRYYYQKTSKGLDNDVDKMGGKNKDFFKVLLSAVILPAEFFANKLKKSTKGLGTDNNLLERILLNRSEVDMATIRDYYQSMFKVAAEVDIADDTSGQYQQLVLGLVRK